MKPHIPFTYHIFCVPTGEHYYGARWRKGCHPNDLWSSYFTSSKIVKDRIRQYGKEAFTFKVRKVFQTSEEAILWETKFLTKINAKERKNWINQHNGDYNFRCKSLSLESKKKISTALKGRKFSEETRNKMSQHWKSHFQTHPHNMVGHIKSKETRDKLSKVLKDKPKSEEHKKNLRVKHKKQLIPTTQSCLYCGRLCRPGVPLSKHQTFCGKSGSIPGNASLTIA